MSHGFFMTWLSGVFRGPKRIERTLLDGSVPAPKDKVPRDRVKAHIKEDILFMRRSQVSAKDYEVEDFRRQSVLRALASLQTDGLLDRVPPFIRGNYVYNVVPQALQITEADNIPCDLPGNIVDNGVKA